MLKITSVSSNQIDPTKFGSISQLPVSTLVERFLGNNGFTTISQITRLTKRQFMSRINNNEVFTQVEAGLKALSDDGTIDGDFAEVDIDSIDNLVLPPPIYDLLIGSGAESIKDIIYFTSDDLWDIGIRGDDSYKLRRRIIAYEEMYSDELGIDVSMLPRRDNDVLTLLEVSGEAREHLALALERFEISRIQDLAQKSDQELVLFTNLSESDVREIGYEIVKVYDEVLEDFCRITSAD